MNIALELLIKAGMTQGEATRLLENRAMTPQEFAEQMKAIAEAASSPGESRDEEWKHLQMDRLLIIALRELGYAEGCDIYNAQSRWYS